MVHETFESDSDGDTTVSSPSTDIAEPDIKVILVTGGAGFIGSHVADHLLSRGDRVVIVDELNDYYDTRLKFANLKYLEEKHGSGKYVFYKGDICDVALLTIPIFSCNNQGTNS